MKICHTISVDGVFGLGDHYGVYLPRWRWAILRFILQILCRDRPEVKISIISGTGRAYFEEVRYGKTPAP